MTESKCVDCGEENFLHALNDELRCDDCVEEWKAQENDNG